jgi:hypothetical protein
MLAAFSEMSRDSDSLAGFLGVVSVREKWGSHGFIAVAVCEGLWRVPICPRLFVDRRRGPFGFAVGLVDPAGGSAHPVNDGSVGLRVVVEGA